MKRTRISAGDRWEDFIEVEGSDGKARLRLHDEDGDVRHVLDTTNILRVINALMVCLFSEAEQADMLSNGVTNDTEEA